MALIAVLIKPVTTRRDREFALFTALLAIFASHVERLLDGPPMPSAAAPGTAQAANQAAHSIRPLSLFTASGHQQDRFWTPVKARRIIES